MTENGARISRHWFRVRRFSRRLWVRATAIALLALIAAWAARLLGPLVPQDVAESLGTSALIRILEILASSMLAVTTFSLAVMVSARQSASTQVTPRSHRLLLEDTTTQTVLATFLGAFVFALVSLIVVSTGFYGERASAVIMAFTLLVIVLVVIAMLRWIEHLSDLGSVTSTTQRVEETAARALESRRAQPCLGARPLTDRSRVPGTARELTAGETGYVQHVDLDALSTAAEAAECEIFVAAVPGAFVGEGEALLHYTGLPDGAAMRAAITLGRVREFSQDARFGVIVLTEIAQRALSPGLNDPGTAIDIIGRLVRLLLLYRSACDGATEVVCPRVWMPPIDASDLMEDSFAPIARDGASTVEVQVRVQKALALLAASDDAEMSAAARAISRRALSQSDEALVLETDRERVRSVAPA